MCRRLMGGVESNRVQLAVGGGGAPSTRYQSLDLWRGMACLLIVTSHASQTITPAEWSAALLTPVGRLLDLVAGHAYIGVPLFFVVSGYCIAATAESTLRRGLPPSRYFWRRLRRIYPPYWAICALSVALLLALSAVGAEHLLTSTEDRIPHPRELDALQWIGSLSLTEIWRHHVVGGPPLQLFGPSWTLCYEEQFYAVCGLALWLAPRHFWRALWLVSLGVLLAGGAALLWRLSFVGFFFDGRWLIFASGLLVYHVVNHASARARVALVGGLCAAVAGGLVVRYGVLARVGTREQKLLLFEVVFGGLFGLLLIALHRHDRLLSSARALAPIRYCGVMCYSLYLVHWPVTLLVTHALDELGVRGAHAVFAVMVPASIASSVALAHLFHLNVERRFLNAPVEPERAPPARVSAVEERAASLGRA